MDEQDEEPDFHAYPNRRYSGHRRGSKKWWLVILMVLAVILGSAYGVLRWAWMEPYHALNDKGDTVVALVQAASNKVGGTLSVTLKFSRQDGRSDTNVYNVRGDQWILQGEVINYPSWLKVIGIPSRYKLLQLEGRDSRTGQVYKAKLTASPQSSDALDSLKGGDDPLYAVMHWLGWASPWEVHSGLPTDGKGYNVVAGSDGEMHLTPVDK